MRMSDTNSHGGGAIDRAIDRAVQRLTEGEPPPGLRRRVLDRIEAPAPWAFPRFALAVGTLALVVLAVLLLRPSPRPVAEPLRTQAAVPAPEATGAATPQPVAVPEPTPRSASARPPAGTREAIPMPRVANVFGARTERAAAAAASVEEVVFPAAEERSESSDLLPAVRPISVPQITIEPLRIEQLGGTRPPTRK